MAKWVIQKTKNEKLAAQTIGHMKSQQCKQKASISVTEEAGFITYYFHTRTGCPWRWKAENWFVFRQNRKRHRWDTWAWEGFRPCWHADNDWGPQSTEAISPDTAFPLNTAAAHEQIQSKQLDLLKHWRLWSLPFGACPPPLSNDKQKCRAMQTTPSWHPLVMKCNDFM